MKMASNNTSIVVGKIKVRIAWKIQKGMISCLHTPLKFRFQF